MAQNKLSDVLQEIDKVWEELFFLIFEISSESSETDEPILEKRTEVSYRQKQKEELLDKARKIITDNREMLVEELASEMAVIKKYGDLSRVPERITGPKHIRFSVANWVIGSMS
ncbi:MAG TPA: hypothetical protein PLW99_00565 [Candidatus Paceibacterota bacterium]|nr:MAG: hypothetical protein B7X03_00990 [Parcubacteria group bacterium 21-58-10]OYV83238.1 MAG: hypothetical protein B7W96_00240 [Parcubacteria group bacterium 37-58-5]HQT82626.1 hypothetical protein [Candidatus Paceibacterota bacterium]